MLHRDLIFSFVHSYTRQVLLLIICMYSMHQVRPPLTYSRVIWINRARLPNLLVVSSTGKLSVLADASVVKYICTAVCICLHTRYIFYLGTCTFVHGSLLYMHICVTTAVSVHMYYECSGVYMFMLCTMISTAALISCSVSSTNECPRIKLKCQGKTWKYNGSRPQSRISFFLRTGIATEISNSSIKIQTTVSVGVLAHPLD